MTKTTCYSLWAGMFILCAGLGFIPAPTGALKFFLTVLSILFFLPPAVLLRMAGNQRNRFHLKLVRNLSLVSLGLTVALILLSFFSLMAPEWVGNFLHTLLVIVSAPMICSGYWVLSLFGWSCLLMVSLHLLRRK